MERKGHGLPPRSNGRPHQRGLSQKNVLGPLHVQRQARFSISAKKDRLSSIQCANRPKALGFVSCAVQRTAEGIAKLRVGDLGTDVAPPPPGIMICR